MTIIIMAPRNFAQMEAELDDEEEFQLALAISQIEVKERTEKTVDKFDCSISVEKNEKLIDFMAKSIERKEAELECPVCLEIAEATMFMCQQQHLICSSCQPRVTSCPECREEYQKPRRHRYAERDAGELKKMKDDLAKIAWARDHAEGNIHLTGIMFCNIS